MGKFSFLEQVQWARLIKERSNIGVLQTTVAELVTVKEHQRRII